MALFASFAALHGRAWQLRHELGLDELGRFELAQDAMAYVALVAAGVLSAIIAVLGVGLEWGLPRLMYLLTPLVTIGQQVLTARKRRELRAARERYMLADS